MFFFQLKDSLMEKAVLLSQGVKLSLKTVVSQALARGLKILSDECATANQPGSQIVPSSAKIHTRREYVNAYLCENWQHKSNQELAQDLGLSVASIKCYLSSLGLHRQRSLPIKIKTRNVETGLRKENESNKQHIADARILHRSQNDELIASHWQQESDYKLARRLEVPITTIIRRRRKLGLHRRQGGFGKDGLITRLKEMGTATLEHMLTQDGYTMTDVVRVHNLHISRERMRQLLEKLGVKHSADDRLPEWTIMRMARQQENMNLANKEWLNEQLQHSSGISDLASQLAVDTQRLAKIIHFFKLTHPSFRKLGREVVDLECAGCGKDFKRLRRWVEQRKKQFPNPLEATFFCKAGCGTFEGGKYPVRKKQERQTFVKEHWPMSDEELAKALTVTEACIKRYRAELDLHYDAAGRPIPPVFQ